MTYKDFIQNILNIRGRFACGKEYHERHHIIPKCLDGTDEEDNLIDLFAKEHYEAHKLLALENPEVYSLQYAWNMMSHCINSKYNIREKIDEEQYELLKKNFSEACSVLNKGKTLTEEHKSKISESNKGKIVSEETKEKMRKSHADYSNGKHPMYGRHHTEQSKMNMRMGQQNRNEQWRKRQSESHKGKKHTQEWKDMMSEKNKGENNPNYGNHKLKGHTLNAKKIICDGIVFDSLTECVEFYGLKSVGNFSCFLNETKKMPEKWKKLGLSWYEG